MPQLKFILEAIEVYGLSVLDCKTKCDQQIMMEKLDVVAPRPQYLLEVNLLKASGHPFVFLAGDLG